MLILQGRGISPNRFFESVVFMDGVACGDAVFSAVEKIYLQNKIIIGI